ncbi:MAG: CAP domain-containing protein, partial [Chloroflexota bacterium]
SVEVQWFERTRLELHPNNARPYDVLLGRIGAEWLEQESLDWTSFAPAPPDTECQMFTETGHQVCGLFRTYYNTHGLNLDGQASLTPEESLALFGLPLSDAMTMTLSDGREYTVQWFERGRFEYHPDNPEPFKVLMGLLGNEVQAFGQEE